MYETPTFVIGSPLKVTTISDLGIKCVILLFHNGDSNKYHFLGCKFHTLPYLTRCQYTLSQNAP
jgi:hypothetical protein